MPAPPLLQPPIAGAPVLDFHEMLQNLASAHAQKVWQLQDEVKWLQAQLRQEKNLEHSESRCINQNCEYPQLPTGSTCNWDLIRAGHNHVESDSIVIYPETYPSEANDKGNGMQPRPSSKKDSDAHASSNGIGNGMPPASPSACSKKDKEARWEQYRLALAEANDSMSVSGGSSPEEAAALRRSKTPLHRKLLRLPVSTAERFLKEKFDAIMCFIIMINAIVLFIEFEFEGIPAAAHLGIIPKEGRRIDAHVVPFQIIGQTFNVIYFFELFFRLVVLRCKFFYHNGVQYLACFDALIVLATLIDTVIMLHSLGAKPTMNASILRLVRLARLTKVLRAVRLMHLFTKLRILVYTCIASFKSLFWATVLLAILAFIASLLICQLVHPYILDDSIPMQERLWMYEFYGTSSRATYTMFEATFAGCWPNYARPLVTQISTSFAVFWCVYIVIVVFAVMRIITALFLQDTMKVMQEDVDMMIHTRIVQRQNYIAKLKNLFEVLDISGDGRLSLEELESMLDTENVKHMFAHLELEVHEVMGLYHLLEDDGDGFVNYDEFLKGIMRLKGQARSLDVIALGRDCENILAKQCQIAQAMSALQETCKQLNAVSVPAVRT